MLPWGPSSSRSSADLSSVLGWRGTPKCCGRDPEGCAEGRALRAAARAALRAGYEPAAGGHGGGEAGPGALGAVTARSSGAAGLTNARGLPRGRSPYRSPTLGCLPPAPRAHPAIPPRSPRTPYLPAGPERGGGRGGAAL